MRYRTTSRDQNHMDIVAALEAADCTVVDLASVGGGVGDILVGVRGRNAMFEIKNPDARGGKKRGRRQQKTLDAQAEFRANWKGHYAVVYSVAEALHQVGCV